MVTTEDTDEHKADGPAAILLASDAWHTRASLHELALLAFRPRVVRQAEVNAV
jgi:hypothetical protein